MTTESERNSWLGIIELIEIYLKENGDSEIIEEIGEFRTIRRVDDKAVKQRESIIRKSRDAKRLDEELALAKPERELLNLEQQAVEMSASLAKMVLELPEMLTQTENRLRQNLDYDSDVRITWRGETENSSDYMMTLSEIRLGTFEEMETTAREILKIIEAGEKEGWQV